MEKDLKDHKYIKIMKFAYENDVFTKEQVSNATNLPMWDVEYLAGNIALLSSLKPQPEDRYKKEYTMKYEAVTNYLEYIELKEARISARSARRFSIAAIIVSTIAILISIYLTIWQGDKPIQLSDDQIKQLQFDDSEIISKLKILTEDNKKTINKR